MALNHLKVAAIANILMVTFFIYSNYLIWGTLQAAYERAPYTYSTWNPFEVTYIYRSLLNGTIVTAQGLSTIPNYPFWLFFLAVAVNLGLIFSLQRSKIKKRPTMVE